MKLSLPGGSPELKLAVERFLRQVLSFPLRLWRVATASLPTASTENEGGIVYDETVSRPAYSDGSSWLSLMPYDAQLAQLAALADPGADRIVFWDDSADSIAYLTAGTGLQISGTSLSCTITQYTDEMARDAIGAALTAGTGITITPNDGADTITVATTITQYTDEMARDAIGAALLGTANEITVTVNDGSDTITLSLPTSLTFTGKTITGGTFSGVALQGTTQFFDANFRTYSSGGNPVIEWDGSGDIDAYIRASNLRQFYIGGSVRAEISTTGLDVIGLSRCDSFRIDQTPVAATPTPTHTFTISLNGTTYRIPCVV